MAMENNLPRPSRMSVMPDMPFIDVLLDPNSLDQEAFKKLVTVIRPQWKGKPIRSKRFREGICNTVLKCWAGGDEADAIVVRINGDRVKIFPLQLGSERIEELKVYHVFRTIGVSPEVLAVFKNGICMEFVEGKQFAWNCIFYENVDDPFIRTNMRELAIYHSSRTTELARQMGFEETPAIIEHSKFLLNSMREQLPDGLDRKRLEDAIGPCFKDILEEELRILTKRCSNLNLPIVFCHGDVNTTNIIYNETKEAVTFVDYESAGFNYAAYELARHIYLVTCGSHEEIEDRLPSGEFILQIIRIYLDERGKVDSELRADEETIRVWYVHVRTAMLFVYYWQTLFSLNWVTNQPMRGNGDEEANDHFVQVLYWSTLSRIDQYWKQKDEILSLSVPGMAPSERLAGLRCAGTCPSSTKAQNRPG